MRWWRATTGSSGRAYRKAARACEAQFGAETPSLYLGVNAPWAVGGFPGRGIAPPRDVVRHRPRRSADACRRLECSLTEGLFHRSASVWPRSRAPRMDSRSRLGPDVAGDRWQNRGEVPSSRTVARFARGRRVPGGATQNLRAVPFASGAGPLTARQDPGSTPRRRRSQRPPARDPGRGARRSVRPEPASSSVSQTFVCDTC